MSSHDNVALTSPLALASWTTAILIVLKRGQPEQRVGAPFVSKLQITYGLTRCTRPDRRERCWDYPKTNPNQQHPSGARAIPGKWLGRLHFEARSPPRTIRCDRGPSWAEHGPCGRIASC